MCITILVKGVDKIPRVYMLEAYQIGKEGARYVSYILVRLLKNEVVLLQHVAYLIMM